jgi:hypothetical protein
MTIVVYLLAAALVVCACVCARFLVRARARG